MSDERRMQARPAKRNSKDKPAVAGYDHHQGEIAVRMGHFFLRYLNGIYREFSGDLALVIVLGEIAHHNVSRYYSASGPLPPAEETDFDHEDLYQNLQPCNAFSLAAATGIPRETVRRKIEQLVRRGWLDRKPNGEVRLRPSVGQHFRPDFNLSLLRELLALSDELKAVLALPPRQVKSRSTPFAQR